MLLTNRDGEQAKALADHTIVAKDDVTSTIQEPYVAIIHTLCHIAEQPLFPKQLGTLSYFA